MRNYDKVIDGDSEKLEVARSSVSRAFIRASQKDLDSINEGQLSENNFVALMIDSLEIGGRTVVAAFGITAAMEKIPVGLREGDTENREVGKDLLASIHERGFTLHCERLLAVIDGAKAWRKALRQVFGERLVVVRCWLHAGALHAALAAEEADDAACVGYHWGVAEELDLPNLIESLFAVVREKIQRVKNWKARRSKQILR